MGLVVGGGEYGAEGIHKAGPQGEARAENETGRPKGVSREEAAASCSPGVSRLGRGPAGGVSREPSQSPEPKRWDLAEGGTKSFRKVEGDSTISWRFCRHQTSPGASTL
ncbi:hypothetical protein CapIbe_010869 [Capra ibex]